MVLKKQPVVTLSTTEAEFVAVVSCACQRVWMRRVLRYLKGTIDLRILYQKRGNGELIAYTDSDYAGDINDRKNTSGYVFLVSDGVVSWS